MNTSSQPGTTTKVLVAFLFSLVAFIAQAADLNETQSSDTVKVVGSSAAGAEQTPVQSTANGALHTNLRDNAGAEIGTSANRLFVDSAPAANVLSTLNSTAVALGAGGVYTGTFEDLLSYADVTVAVLANVASATNGFEIQWSADGSTVLATDVYNVLANTGKLYSFGTNTRYFRVKYTNGAGAQASFRIQTIFKRQRGKPSSNRVEEAITAEDDTEVVKSVITGKSPDGSYKNVRVDVDGNFIITALTGFGAAFTFGDVSLASAANTVAVRRTTYTEQTTNAQRSIVSANAADASAGTGARTVMITYLDQTGAGPYTETLTLNGVTPVNTVSTTICFIEKMEVVTVGSGTVNAGIISLKAATAGGGATVGTIGTGDRQTFWAHHYVPVGKTTNITGASISNDSTSVGNGALFTIRSIQIGVANAIEKQISDFLSLFGQASVVQRNYTSPIKIVGPARVTAYVLPNNNTAQIFRFAFDFFEP